MYQKILLPLDGSTFSESIVPVAQGLVADGGGSAELILYSVVEPFRNQPSGSSDDWNERMMKEAEQVSRNYLEQVAERLKAGGCKTKVVVEFGEPAQAILDFVEKNGVDLIVMSTHGRSGLARLVFGSVAQRIVHHAAVPVLVAAPPGLRSA
jgi:nucleotide-binding universal stress UspA family protein